MYLVVFCDGIGGLALGTVGRIFLEAREFGFTTYCNQRNGTRDEALWAEIRNMSRAYSVALNGKALFLTHIAKCEVFLVRDFLIPRFQGKAQIEWYS